MHICMVMAGDEEGGLEKHVIEMVNGLVQQGQQVTLIAHAKYASRVHGVNFKSVDLTKSRKNPFLLWQLYRLIKQIKPDVLHVHANKAVAMIAPLLKWLDVPSVATLHNLKRNIHSFEKFDRVIAVSQRVAKQFKKQDAIRVVLNGVHAPSSYLNRTSSTPLQVIAIGRLVPAKGLDLLVEAWQGIDANLWIVGDGPEKLLLESRIQQLNLSEKIQLLGHRDDINDLLQQADFLVISSRNEGGPYTLSEALLQHRPVISTDVGMVPEVLPGSLICAANDVTALHQLIETYVNDFAALKQQSEEIYVFAQQQLTIDAMIQNTLQVYRELINA
ncbi:glycosyltransferase [Acinetobacter sp.]|uniref:glycosyltransferase n=1 Tax=Acinetobacter sp. TaxID=472 RepID=UPI00388D2693